jgi:Predicted metal-dependent hydrolase
MSNNSLNKLYIGNEVYEYTLKYSKRKSLEIKIKNDGQIYVSAPFYVSIKEIEDVLNKKSVWIEKKLHLMKEQCKNPYSELASKGTILFMGQDILFNITENNKKRVYLSFDGGKLDLEIPVGFQSHDKDILIKENLKRFYKKNTEDYLEQKIEYYEKVVGVKSVDFKVKDQKTRWGSCSSKGNLNFNFRLSMAPDYVFDYIIVHELCHLKEMNHSKRFWALVKCYYPEYNKANIWLKNNSRKLMFI